MEESEPDPRLHASPGWRAASGGSLGQATGNDRGAAETGVKTFSLLRRVLFASVSSTDKVQSAKSAAFAKQNRQRVYKSLKQAVVVHSLQDSARNLGVLLDKTFS